LDFRVLEKVEEDKQKERKRARTKDTEDIPQSLSPLVLSQEDHQGEPGKTPKYVQKGNSHKQMHTNTSAIKL
jgi:hypothetical protein